MNPDLEFSPTSVERPNFVIASNQMVGGETPLLPFRMPTTGPGVAYWKSNEEKIKNYVFSGFEVTLRELSKVRNVYMWVSQGPDWEIFQTLRSRLS
jgi:hypothetical protein